MRRIVSWYRTGRPFYGQKDHFVSKYLDCPNEPLFPFGYGLSYSSVHYKNFHVIKENDSVFAEITVQNCSNLETLETVQLYIHDCAACVVRPIKELKGFRQICLKAGESKTVCFPITKDMLKFYNKDLAYVFEPGEFDIMIGKNSREVTSQRVLIE